jgi:hypothetical protein
MPGRRRLRLLRGGAARVARRAAARGQAGEGRETRSGKTGEATAQDIWSPFMTRTAFERLVAEAITLIPRRFRDEMRNLAIVVEDEPSDATLEAVEIEPPDSLYGLYEGTPLPERQWADGNRLPESQIVGPVTIGADDDLRLAAFDGEDLSFIYDGIRPGTNEWPDPTVARSFRTLVDVGYP